MLIAHLDQLGLVCPACGAAGRTAPPLATRMVLSTDTTRAGEDLLEGVLVCPDCRRQHPVIDGVVIAVADLAGWAAHELDALLRRHDLSPILERLLGEAAAGTGFDRERRALSDHVTAQWSDRAIGAEVAAPGTFAHRCAAAMATLPAEPTGTWLDVGCGAGRGTFQLAAAGAGLALGVDPDIALLRRAEHGRRTGTVTWPRHRSGQVFDAAEAEVGGLPRAQVGFVCADLAALPFRAGLFTGALALADGDRLPLSAAHRAELTRVLAAGGAVLAG